MSDAPLRRCEKCGGPCERLIGGGAGLIFKGSGFYSTDYRKPAPKVQKKPEAPTPATTETKPKKEKFRAGD